MNSTEKLNQLNSQLNELKRAASIIESSGADIPAVVRNVRRIMASIKMLEINIADAAV